MSLIKIFITGGNGMVGRNLIEKLNNPRFAFEAPKSKELDLFDYNQLLNFLKKRKFDIVARTKRSLWL